VPTYRDDAVVLRTHKLGEADRIITLLSRRHGKIRAVAKGVRRTTSKFGGRLEPFSHVDVQFATGRTLDVVTQAVTLHAFTEPLGSDYPAYTTGQVMLETADRLVAEEGEPALQQYQLLLGALNARASRPSPSYVTPLSNWYQPRAIVWHHHRADADSLAQQMYGYGSGFTAYAFKTATTPRHFLRISRLTASFLWRRIVRREKTYGVDTGHGECSDDLLHRVTLAASARFDRDHEQAAVGPPLRRQPQRDWGGTHEPRRIGTGLGQERRQHGAGGGLAVGSRHRQRRPPGTDRTQDPGPVQDRDPRRLELAGLRWRRSRCAGSPANPPAREPVPASCRWTAASA